MNWKTTLGHRLKELRQNAHGRGFSQKRAASTIGKTTAYVNRLENKMATENPTLNTLDQLCALYGVTIGDLFAPLVTDRSEINIELKEKLDFILSSGVEKTIIGITENIHAMHERTRFLKKA